MQLFRLDRVAQTWCGNGAGIESLRHAQGQYAGSESSYEKQDRRDVFSQASECERQLQFTDPDQVP